MIKEDQFKQLQIIPGVGKSISNDLWDIGIKCVDDLKGKSMKLLFAFILPFIFCGQCTFAIYLDFFSSMADNKNAMKPEYSEDRVHPNKTGYKVMEGLLDEVLGTIFE